MIIYLALILLLTGISPKAAAQCNTMTSVGGRELGARNPLQTFFGRTPGKRQLSRSCHVPAIRAISGSGPPSRARRFSVRPGRATLPVDDTLPHSAMMTLKMVVDRYMALAGQAGAPVALSDFAWSPSETEKTFNGFDEDYHVSRYLHFSKGEGRGYTISGEEVTHIVIDAGISHIL